MADVQVNIDSDTPSCSDKCTSGAMCEHIDCIHSENDDDETININSTSKPRTSDPALKHDKISQCHQSVHISSNLRTVTKRMDTSEFQQPRRDEKQGYDNKLDDEIVHFDRSVEGATKLDEKRPEHLFTNRPSHNNRRAKINLRERKRMHDLNEALESLREVMPYASGPSVRRLSKIATLSLARNYIQMLTKSIEDLRKVLDEVFRANPTMASSVLANRPVHTNPGLLHGVHGLYINGHTPTHPGITPPMLHRQYLTNQEILNRAGQQIPTMTYTPKEFTCNTGHPCELQHFHCVLQRNVCSVDSMKTRFK